MFKLLFLLSFLVLSTSLFAQPSIQWQKTYGGSLFDEAVSVIPTTDGGYILAGYTVSDDGDVVGSHGNSDFWVLKLDSMGIVSWKKTYGGSNHDIAFSIQEASDGGYIVAGYTKSNNGDVSGNHGDYDAWVLKLDSDGDIQWQKALGGSGWEEAWSVQQTTDGGFIIAGRSGSTDGDVTGFHGYLDYWVVKLNSLGELEWQKSLGGTGLDIGYTISQTDDGGYIVDGRAESTDGDLTGQHGSADFWVVKLNFEGKIEWEKSLGGTGLDRANDIHQTRDGGYIAIGQSTSINGDVTGGHGGNDYWVVKLTSDGNIEWQKSMGGSMDDFGRFVCQTDDGGYVTIGITRSTDGDILNHIGVDDIWIVKLTEFGEIKWQKMLGGSLNERSNCIQQTTDGGYILAGYTWSNDGDVSGVQGYNDFWIVKLSPESSPTSAPSSLPLEIFPNPATQTISLQIPSEEPTLSVCITDLLGREINLQTIPSSQEIDISSLPNGFYLVTATTPSGKVFSGKLRKQ